MIPSMKLNDLYISILACAGQVVDKEGFISSVTGKDKSPTLVSGKRLVLPTQDQLMNSDTTNRIIFHPLMENFLRGESDVISKLRHIFNIRLNYTFAMIATSLLTIISSVGEHNKLTPDQSEILSFVKDVDEKTLHAFQSMLLNSMKESADRTFVNIYLKRKATINGEKYARGGIVSFPFLEELLKDQDKYHGSKIRTKDRAAIIQLFEYIFPGSSKPESYNRGSNSDIAPYLDSLMQTVLGMAGKFNDILDLYGSLIECNDEIVFNSDWVETFKNLQVMIPEIRQVPMQAGNEGKAKAGEFDVPEVQSGLEYKTPAQSAPVNVQPKQNFSQQFAPQQTMQAQPMRQQPQVEVTDRGVVFDSVMRTNPALAGVASMYGRSYPQQSFQPQQHTPLWASNPQQNYGMGMNNPMGGMNYQGNQMYPNNGNFNNNNNNRGGGIA